MISYDKIFKETDREFNYRGHSYPLWIVGGSGPIFLKYLIKLSVLFMPTYIDNSVRNYKRKVLQFNPPPEFLYSASC